MKRLLALRSVRFGATAAAALATGTYVLTTGSGDEATCDYWQSQHRKNGKQYSSTKPIECRDGTKVFPWSAPPREQHLKDLKEKVFDVLVIGGGCVGNGVALDAATRGLDVALVDRDDFASGTSGRSTKLIHGGVRYLQNAILHLDISQYRLVREALAERSHMLTAAPYIAHAQPIMIPLEHWWQVPFMWVGTKIYDFIAGKHLSVPPSMYIGKAQAAYAFPMLKTDTYGAIVYYDGQMNDSRYALLVALTAAQAGASIGNHININRLSYSKKTGKINGAYATDKLTGEEFKIRAKSVVNCTGPFTDSIRKMAHDVAGDGSEKEFKEIVLPAGGIHVVLPDHFSPLNMGLIVPETRDGRVLFFLPWEGGTLCGTTDSESPISMLPKPTLEEVDFVLAESSRYLNRTVKRRDVLAAWSGIRPLVRNPNAKDTQSVSREHVIEVNEGGMVTCAGGKWTTYRQMAEDAMDKVLEVHKELGLRATQCVTKNLQLIGADRARIVCDQSFDIITVTLREDYGFDKDMAVHLTRNYGTRALQVAEIVREGYLSRQPNLHPKRLVAKYPILEAEVVFAVKQEYAMTPHDFLARRCRMGFIDQKAALEALPNVVSIMSKLHGWSSAEAKKQTESTKEFLDTMLISFEEEEM